MIPFSPLVSLVDPVAAIVSYSLRVQMVGTYPRTKPAFPWLPVSQTFVAPVTPIPAAATKEGAGVPPARERSSIRPWTGYRAARVSTSSCPRMADRCPNWMHAPSWPMSSKIPVAPVVPAVDSSTLKKNHAGEWEKNPTWHGT